MDTHDQYSDTTNESNNHVDLNEVQHPSIDQPVFPPKPQAITTPISRTQSMISFVLFIAAFAFFYDWDFAYLGMLLVVLLIHEAGHYLAMKYYNYNDLSIFFIPLLGAAATGNKEQVSQKQEAIVLLAGPLPGVIIGSVLYFIFMSTDDALLGRLSTLFIFINIFNLLPVLPLDGGRLIKTLYFQTNQTITTIFLYLSILVTAYLAFTMQAYAFLIVPAFMVMQLINQRQLNQVKKTLKENGISMNQVYHELSDRDYWLIRNELGTQMNAYAKIITPFHYEESPREYQVIKVIKQMLKPNDVSDLSVFGKVIFTLIWVISFVIPIAVALMFVLNK